MATAELRAPLSLAHSWNRGYRIDHAKRVLEPIYARFSEGFSTAVL